MSDAVPDWQRRDPVAIDPVQYKAWCDDKLAGLRGEPRVMPAAPATGAVQRKGASARELAGTAVEMTTSSPRVLALEAAIAVLEDAEADAQHLLRKVASGAISHDRAYGQLVPIIHAMLAPLAHFDSAQRAPSVDADRAAQQQSLERWRPRVLDALDNLARVALLLDERERAAGGALTRGAREASGLIVPGAIHDQIAVEAGIGAFASVGVSLGWSPPATRAEADARRYAHEACPTGAADDRPEHCNLPDSERVQKRGEVVQLIGRAIDNFITACAPFEAQLEQMVATIAAGRELILGIVTDAVKTGIGAVTAGVGGKIFDFALGVSYTLGKVQLKRPGAHDAIREADSLTMLSALKDALRAQLESIGDQTAGLDDLALGRVHGRLEVFTVEFFAEKVAPFVAAYREQIEPIGHIAPAYRDQTQGARFRGVWAVAGERRRLALVIDRPYTMPLRAGEVRHEYRFQRWIDPQFETVVGDDAIDVPADSIDGIPFAWVAGVAP